MGSLAPLSPLPGRGVKRMRPDHLVPGTASQAPLVSRGKRRPRAATVALPGPQPLRLAVSHEVSPPASELCGHQCCRRRTQAPPGSCLTGSTITTHSTNHLQRLLCTRPCGPQAGGGGGGEGGYGAVRLRRRQTRQEQGCPVQLRGSGRLPGALAPAQRRSGSRAGRRRVGSGERGASPGAQRMSRDEGPGAGPG